MATRTKVLSCFPILGLVDSFFLKNEFLGIFPVCIAIKAI